MADAIRARDAERLIAIASRDLAVRTTAAKLVADLDRAGLTAARSVVLRPARPDLFESRAPVKGTSLKRLDALIDAVVIEGEAELAGGVRVPLLLVLSREDERWRLADIRVSVIGISGR